MGVKSEIWFPSTPPCSTSLSLIFASLFPVLTSFLPLMASLGNGAAPGLPYPHFNEFSEGKASFSPPQYIWILGRDCGQLGSRACPLHQSFLPGEWGAVIVQIMWPHLGGSGRSAECVRLFKTKSKGGFQGVKQLPQRRKRMLVEKGKEYWVDNHRFLLRHSTMFQILALFSTLRLNSLKTRTIDSGVRWSWLDPLWIFIAFFTELDAQ